MYKEYVVHPRYGDKPMYSGNNYSRDEIINSFWSYRRDKIFQETAIPANISNQNYSICPRKLYVDIEKSCRQCKRPFLFFAMEQKYWYEDLHFYVDADCVKCVECRKKEQSIKFLMIEYENLLKNNDRTNEQTKRLKQVALKLFQVGYITNENKVNQIVSQRVQPNKVPGTRRLCRSYR